MVISLALYSFVYVADFSSNDTLVLRPGASSGIFLGAITLPGVFFSRLIQMHRGVSAKDVVPEGHLLVDSLPNLIS